MRERLKNKVEDLVGLVKKRGKKRVAIPPEDFIDLLNFGIDNPGVEIIGLNKFENCRYIHEARYKGIRFKSSTQKAIYDL